MFIILNYANLQCFDEPTLTNLLLERPNDVTELNLTRQIELQLMYVYVIVCMFIDW